MRLRVLLVVPPDRRNGIPRLHRTLQSLQDSPLGRAECLDVAMHVPPGRLVTVTPGAEVPEAEVSFRRLLGAAAQGDQPLHDNGPMPPDRALASFAQGALLRFDAAGPVVNVDAVARRGEEGALTAVLSVAGPLGEAWAHAAPEAVSLWPGRLVPWAVAAELAGAWRRAWHMEATAWL